MKKTRRYTVQVEITVRMPKELRDRAKKIVDRLDGREISAPHADGPVKVSMAVLALRGLEAEVARWEKKLEAKT